ncbi:hypothetical protein BX600DRAFT_403128 [Xylariales sp. PMI_506]|nr:hypothetical protein BX600DRAFT_403128 [Xylariales sp. PMI_506]
MSFDPYSCLAMTCQDAARYPANGIRTRLFRHTLKAYQDQLVRRNDDLFDSTSPYPIDFLDAYDGEPFQRWECKGVVDLGQRLWINRKDPRCRHVFIQADTSISPLDCSKETFLYLLSFHNAMPRFLDLIFAFGSQPTPPVDFHYTAFQHENFLDHKSAHDYTIPKLGRSGRQIRHSYNLWSVEWSDADNRWTFRQTATYHSFDIDNGRAFWIHVKANDLMLKRIGDVLTMPESHNAESQLDSVAVFRSTLTTHLVIFEWCSEKWRDYLTNFEREIDDILIAARNAPLIEIEQMLSVDFEALLTAQQTAPVSPSRVATLPRPGTISSQVTTTLAPKRVLSGLAANSARPHTAVPGQSNQPGQQSLDALVSQQPLEKFRVFKQFSVKSLQRLGAIGSELQRAALIMKSDVEVITGVAEQYSELINTDQFPHACKAEYAREVASFKEQSQDFIRSLDSARTRVITLLKTLEDGNKLFETILQFRNMEISKLFAVSARESAERVEGMTVEMHESTIHMEKLTRDMGRIAEKTKQETNSIHIITFVTLVFLPATFVATLFGSGLFQWDQNNPDMPLPMWKQEYFNLFAEICLPITFAVIIGWGASYVWLKRRGEQMKMIDIEAQTGCHDLQGTENKA